MSKGNKGDWEFITELFNNYPMQRLKNINALNFILTAAERMATVSNTSNRLIKGRGSRDVI